jgi:hypothetical protein
MHIKKYQPLKRCQGPFLLKETTAPKPENQNHSGVPNYSLKYYEFHRNPSVSDLANSTTQTSQIGVT